MNTENALIALTYLLKYQEITCNLAWGGSSRKRFLEYGAFLEAIQYPMPVGQLGINQIFKPSHCDDNRTLYPITPRVFMQVYVINPTLKTVSAVEISGSIDDVRGLIGFASIDSDEIDNNGDRLFFDEECFIRQQDGVGRFKVDNLAPVAGIGVIANSRDEAKSIQAPEVSLQDLTKRITFI